MEEESVSSLQSECSDVPDLNTLLITDHIILTEDRNSRPSSGEKKSAPEKLPNPVDKKNDGRRRNGPNLLSKSMLVKLQRKGTVNRDPLKDMQQYARRKESGVPNNRDNGKNGNTGNKTVVWINIQDMDGENGFSVTPGMGNSYPRKSYVSYLGDPSQPTTPRDKMTSSQWERAAQRVNLAFEHVQKVANRERESQLAGIPTNAFQLMQPQGPQLKVITEIKASVLNRRRRMKAQGLGPKSPPQESPPKKPVNLDIPRGFAFPKEQNFIRDQTKIEKIGVGWQMQTADQTSKSPPESIASSQSSYTPVKVPKVPQPPGIGPRSSSTIPGRLCRAAFPVTEALHRHGTSITKLKGKALRPGEMNVAKVWPRKLDVNSHQPRVNPVQMAYEDVPGGEGFILQVAMENRRSPLQ